MARHQLFSSTPKSATETMQSARRLLVVSARLMILIGGGDPQRIHDHVAGTRAQEALRQNWVDGAVVAGCSAGAAVLGAGMISGPPDAPVRLEMMDWLDGPTVAPHFGGYAWNRGWMPSRAAA